jgi:two-component sensor histidine kinase
MSFSACSSMQIISHGRPGEQLLVRELTHRINNELASTAGFISLAAARSTNTEVKAVLAGVMEHIHGIAGIYRALQMPAADESIDAAEYLRTLCQLVSCAKLRHRGVELIFTECALDLNAVQCWRLGMIVSELISNASRHAFASRGGSIRIELFEGNGFVQCVVADDGAGYEKASPGQGTKIVRSLVDDLGGSIHFCSGAAGTSATVSFPVCRTSNDRLDGINGGLHRDL